MSCKHLREPLRNFIGSATCVHAFSGRVVMGKTQGESSPRGRAWVVLGAAGAAGVAVGVLRGFHRAAKSLGRGEGRRARIARRDHAMARCAPRPRRPLRRPHPARIP